MKKASESLPASTNPTQTSDLINKSLSQKFLDPNINLNLNIPRLNVSNINFSDIGSSIPFSAGFE
jgi:hypothetical protein